MIIKFRVIFIMIFTHLKLIGIEVTEMGSVKLREKFKKPILTLNATDLVG